MTDFEECSELESSAVLSVLVLVVVVSLQSDLSSFCLVLVLSLSPNPPSPPVGGGAAAPFGGFPLVGCDSYVPPEFLVAVSGE